MHHSSRYANNEQAVLTQLHIADGAQRSRREAFHAMEKGAA